MTDPIKYGIVGFLAPLVFVIWVLICGFVGGTQMEPRSLFGAALFISPLTGLFGHWLGAQPS